MKLLLITMAMIVHGDTITRYNTRFVITDSAKRGKQTVYKATDLKTGRTAWLLKEKK